MRKIEAKVLHMEEGEEWRLVEVEVLLIVRLLLPARASEQGNVIGSVRIYIYGCVQIFFCN